MESKHEIRMKKLQLIVIIPVGPTTNTEFLLDTIASIRHYCTPSHRIILTNDSQRSLAFEPAKYNCDEVVMERSMGKQSGLYFSLCAGMKHALRNYDFEVLLRMDDDALITGPKPELDATKYFQMHPRVGMLGSYRVTWNGEERSFDPPKREIEIETSWLWSVMKLVRRQTSGDIRPIVRQAQHHGYELGEHVLGGVYFVSPSLLEKLDQKNWLPCRAFRGSRLEEDHIFGLLTKALGMKLADFVTGEFPMCLKWKGMPASPQEIHALGKKVIHSTRFYEQMDEAAVREEFQTLRRQQLR